MDDQPTSPSQMSSHISLSTKPPKNIRSLLSSSLQASLSSSKNTQLSSPVCLPLLESNSLCDNPDSNIFERSVQDLSAPVKHEDCIPPALDATARILGSKDTNLDEVEMVYSSRRNSSVIGLNMALGRPCAPSRKNSVYSMNNALSSSSNNNINSNINSSAQNIPIAPSNASLSSISHFPPQLPVSPPKLSSSKSSVSFYSYNDMINNDEFARRPSLLPSFSHTGNPGSSASMSRKMSAASNFSLNGTLTTPSTNPFSTFTSSPSPYTTASSNNNNNNYNKLSRKLTLASVSSAGVTPQSQLSKQFAPRQPTSGVPSRKPSKKEKSEVENSSNKFMISPESSESEDNEIFYPATSNPEIATRRRSVTSLSSNLPDNESLISASMGDCIRECTSQIGGSS